MSNILPFAWASNETAQDFKRAMTIDDLRNIIKRGAIIRRQIRTAQIFGNITGFRAGQHLCKVNALVRRARKHLERIEAQMEGRA